MNKDSHFTGQPVYSQVLKLLDKEKILRISRETKGSEAYVKRLDGYQHLVVMLFGILKHFDSLRELEIGMKAEAHKLRHLGMDYLVRRSTLAEANIRRPQEFFASVYSHLLEKYAKFLADSRPPKSYKGQTHEPKDWEKLLYMMDSLKYIGESVTFYHVATIRVTNADGTVTEKRAVVDQNGTIRSKNLALKQTSALIKTCTELTMSSANLALMTAGYTAAMPSLGLNAIKYGKYIKIGGQLTGRCTTEMVDLLKRLRQQGKEIRAFKKSFSESGELANPSLNMSNIDGIDFSATPVVEKSNEDFERELAEAAKDDQENSGDVDDSLFDVEAA